MNEKIFLRGKSVGDSLNWILFVEGIKSLPIIDLTYQYRLEFKKHKLYLRDGFNNLLIANEYEKTKWISCLQIFIERCMKLRELNSEVSIDFPILNRRKFGGYYSYLFRYYRGKLFLDVREGYILYNEETYSYLFERKMKNLSSVEIPIDKIIEMIKTKVNLKRKFIDKKEQINSIINKIDKQKIKW